MDEDDDLNLPPCLEGLLALSGEEEEALLERILEKGWELGSLIELPDGCEPPALSPGDIQALIGSVSSRDHAYPSGIDPFEVEPPRKTVYPSDVGAYLILNQRCDLIMGIKREPLVAVAPAKPVEDKSVAAAIKSRNSATHLFVGVDDRERVWAADVRAMGYIPKTWLGGCEPYFPLSAGRERRRLAGEIAKRFQRQAVPTTVVRQFQDPVRGLYQNAKFRALTGIFKKFLLLEGDQGMWQLIGLVEEGQNADDANEKFDELITMIDEKTPDFRLDIENSGAVRVDEIPLSDYLTAIIPDFDRVTYGSKSNLENQAEPDFLGA